MKIEVYCNTIEFVCSTEKCAVCSAIPERGIRDMLQDLAGTTPENFESMAEVHISSVYITAMMTMLMNLMVLPYPQMPLCTRHFGSVTTFINEAFPKLKQLIELRKKNTSNAHLN